MKKLYILAASILALVACDKSDDNRILSSEPTTILASIGESAASRASGTSWANGDEIGITVVKGNNVETLYNIKYTTDGSENFSGSPIYFYNPMTFTAYYPFAGEVGTDPGTLEAETTADFQKPDTQPDIDFLWDHQDQILIEDNKPVVRFTFGHKMSKITLIFQNGNEATDVSNIVSYMIEGLVMGGTFNTETGECAAKNQQPEDLKIVLDSGAVKHNEPVPSLILFPQKFENGSIKLHLYADELNGSGALQHYSCPINFPNGELLPGTNYVYTISVTKTKISVKSESITNWSDTEGEAGAGSDD